MQLSAERAILTCFIKPCQALRFLILFTVCFAASLSLLAAAISEDYDYSMLLEAVNGAPKRVRHASGAAASLGSGDSRRLARLHSLSGSSDNRMPCS